MTGQRIVGLCAALGLLLAAGPALAKTIVGTPRDDVLRGTPGADRLYGKGGNDRLYGKGGNDRLFGGAGNDVLVGGPGRDVLVGGPGADRLVCGPGRDIAYADARDRVAKDCEVVRGLGPPPPPATPGTYCGVTSQGMSLCLDVETRAFGVVVAAVRLDVQTACDPPRQLAFTYRLTTQALVVDTGAFVSNVAFAGLSARVEGAFDASRVAAAGTLRVQAEAVRGGVDYTCDSGVVSWEARTPPPAPVAEPGRFCGSTGQGLGLCFDVAGAPKTVANLELVVRFECTPPSTLGISSTIPTAYAIRADATFAFERIGTGTTAAGGSFTVTHAVRGAFDATGTAAAGMLQAHLDYTAPDSVRHECDSGEVAWTARKQ